MCGPGPWGRSRPHWRASGPGRGAASSFARGARYRWLGAKAGASLRAGTSDPTGTAKPP
jgi:hypothetical protein